MKLGELYQASVDVGMAADPRGKEALLRQMQDLAAEYEAMSVADKRLFDTERLTNPFGDTRIVYGDPETELKRVIIGIDSEGPELLLAAELSRRGRQVDAVISHHTSWIAPHLVSRHDTAIPQVAMAVQAGVPEGRACKLVLPVTRERPCPSVRGMQIAQAVSMPVMCIHSPADACMYELMQQQLDTHQPRTVGEIVELACTWPECQWLMDTGYYAPHLDAGDAVAPVGRVYMALYGGWNPTPELFEELCKAGVSTFIVVASTREFRELAGRYGAAIVVMPHYPADNAGINIMLDRIMPDGDEFEIIDSSNFVRIRRPAQQ